MALSCRHRGLLSLWSVLVLDLRLELLVLLILLILLWQILLLRLWWGMSMHLLWVLVEVLLLGTDVARLQRLLLHRHRLRLLWWIAVPLLLLLRMLDIVRWHVLLLSIWWMSLRRDCRSLRWNRGSLRHTLRPLGPRLAGNWRSALAAKEVLLFPVAPRVMDAPVKGVPALCVLPYTTPLAADNLVGIVEVDAGFPTDFTVQLPAVAILGL